MRLKWKPELITDDKFCPFCHKRNCCKKHSWCYSKWYYGLEEGMTAVFTEEEKLKRQLKREGKIQRLLKKQV